MKRLWIGVGAALVLVLVVVATLVIEEKLYEREIRNYAGAAILAIASNWNEQALLERASPELFAYTNPQDIDETFLKYRQLGRMTSLSEGTGHFDVVVTPAGKKETAVYIAKAHFERRAVAIKLSLIKHNGSWQIMGFNVMPARPPWP